MDVAVLVVDGVGDLGLASVLGVFGIANSLLRESNSAISPWRVQTIAAEAGVRSGNGCLVPSVPLTEFTTAADMLIVPATSALDTGALVREVTDPANTVLLHHISESFAAGAHLAAACTGTFYLAEAGVLDGIAATTSWWLGPVFRRRYPRIDVHDSDTLCVTDRVTTAGATLAHLDLALSLVAERSPELAQTAARYLLAGDRRNQRQLAISEVLARGDSLIADFERWVRDHLSEQFQITDAAAALGVTPRSLQRATHAELGMSPREFVNEIRLERATVFLQDTAMTVETIARKVGYLNPGTLRTLFRRRRGQTITEVRSASGYWDGTASHQ
ncbi:GlxA family transcriptional regulator [Nocardia sp. NPDC004722]